MLHISSDLYKKNRFFFIIAAAKRAHALQENFATPMVITSPEEKTTITALRELAEGLIHVDGSGPTAPFTKKNNLGPSNL